MRVQRVGKRRATARGILPRALVSCALATTIASVGLVGCDGAERDASGGAISAELDLDAAGMKDEINAMLRISDTLDRHRRMVQLMDAIDASNLQGAVDAYDENMSRIDPHEARLFANRWAELAPRDAVDGILDWPYPRSKNQAVLEAVFKWIQEGGGKAARAYVDPRYKGPAEPRRSPTKFMYLAVLQGLGVAKDWDDLTDMMAAAENEGDRELWLTETMIEINRAHDINAVKEWLDFIPWETPGKLKVSAMKRGLHWVAGLDYDQATAWYEEIESHPDAVETLPMAVQAWGVREPPNAIAWLLERPQNGIRDTLLREIMVGWLARAAESADAEAWIRANADDETVKITGLVPLATHLVENRRFEEAADLIREQASPRNRDQALSGTFVRWAQAEPAAVDAYIAKHEIANAIVETFRRRLAKKAVRVDRRRQPRVSEDQG